MPIFVEEYDRELRFVLPPFLLETIDILKQRTTKIELKKYAISLMDSVGSFQHTKRRLCSLYSELLDLVEDFGGNDALVTILNRLHCSLEEANVLDVEANDSA